MTARTGVHLWRVIALSTWICPTIRAAHWNWTFMQPARCRARPYRAQKADLVIGQEVEDCLDRNDGQSKQRVVLVLLGQGAALTRRQRVRIRWSDTSIYSLQHSRHFVLLLPRRKWRTIHRELMFRIEASRRMQMSKDGALISFLVTNWLHLMFNFFN